MSEEYGTKLVAAPPPAGNAGVMTAHRDLEGKKSAATAKFWTRRSHVLPKARLA